MRRIESCLTCEWLGNTLFGVDVDDVFQYETTKVVKIHDRTLGLTKLVLSLLIFFYIVVYQLFYLGQHFEAIPVEGSYRLQWQHPVKDHCNPDTMECVADYTPFDQLQYCDQYAGRNASAAVRPCAYFDAWELPMQVNDGVLLPTFIRTFKQRKMCFSGEPECTLKWQYVDEAGEPQRGVGDAKPISEQYVADVEDFTVLIDHAFRLSNGMMGYDDYHMKGNWKQCFAVEESWENEIIPKVLPASQQNCTIRPTTCAHDGGACAEANHDTDEEPVLLATQQAGDRRKMRGRRTSTESGGKLHPNAPWDASEFHDVHAVEPEVISITNGDVISVRTLLAMAGRSLDGHWYEDEGEPLSPRLRGTIIVVHVNYHNMVPWTLFHAQDPPEYTIEVVSRPVYRFKHTYVSSETENMRTLVTAYGIQIIIQQAGDVRIFNLVHGLLIVTAALGLLAMANTLTNMLAMYILPRRAEYKSAMFEDTEDHHPPPQKPEAS